MKISVVIPTYNEEKCLGNCLSALCNGSVLPDEVIVSDGMSNDNTVNVAKEYNAKVIYNSKRHAAGGRNAGINNAN